MLESIAGFALVAGLVTIVPGIDTALVLRATVARGRVAGYAAALGISLGCLVWAIAAAIGITALLSVSELAFTVLRWAGACYLVYLGLRLLWASRPGRVAPASTAAPESLADMRRGSLWADFRVGLFANLLNPKVGVFYLAVLPQFIPSDVAPLTAGIVLALVHDLEGLVWFSALIFGTHALRGWLRDSRVAAWIDRVTGGVLVVFGTRIALG